MSEVTSVEPAATPRPPRTASQPAGSSALGSHVAGIDGIRGLALLVMLGFHAELPATKGAFLALSQFFTLSGFLITGVLLRNHLAPGKSLRPFWARRARRLMPAAFVALAGVVVFGATVATRQQAQALPGDVLAAATWTANWRFILSGRSYVDLFAAPSPVQHFWSLAVEEQFYLVLPVALFFLVRRTRSWAVLTVALAAAAAASTAWMIFLFSRGASIDRIYYGTDTRMEEFLIGSVLAVVLLRTGYQVSDRVRRVILVVSLLAFGATVWGWVAISDANTAMWRGGIALFSLASCALILCVVTGAGPVSKFYSWKPLTATGVICYGLYLYHWPIFLWLTPERTGLSRWPLFLVRVALTYAAAIVSYRFIERPILRGQSFAVAGKARYALAPAMAVVLVVTCAFTVNRGGADPLATLTTSASMPREASDGVLDLLVIPENASDPVMRQLAIDAHANKSVRLTMTAPFACTGGLVAAPSGRTCGNWAQTWPALVAAHNPDAVLIYADNWGGEPLAKLFGPSASAQTAGAAAVLGAGVNLLTARGAPVIWAASGKSFVDALRLSVHPFNTAMTQLVAQRTDMHEVVGGHLPDPATVTHSEYVTRSAQALLQDASLYQRQDGHSKARVFIVGDSQALSLGYGLDRWTAEHNRALVWNHGVEACGVVVAGETKSGTGNSGYDRCRDAANAWPAQLKSFRPDEVIVFSSLTDIQPRKLPGATRFSSIGDAAFDAFLVSQYEHVIDVLSSTGARVVWIRPPCTTITATAGQPNPYSAQNIGHLDNVILPKVMRDRRGRVVSFDLAGILCPNGRPLRSVDNVGEIRPDGVHFSVPAALWFANSYADGLLKAGGI